MKKWLSRQKEQDKTKQTEFHVEKITKKEEEGNFQTTKNSFVFNDLGQSIY